MTGTPPATTKTITGLTAGTAYTFTVQAINPGGAGPVSSPSNAVTPSGAGVPAAPTGVTAQADTKSANVDWTAPADDGGSAITGYRITPYAGSTAGTPVDAGASATRARVTGLTNGTAYTLQGPGRSNAGGPGTASAATSAVTPKASILELATPGVVDAGDNSAVNLGVKFRSSVAGQITGLRFYKSASNTGTHVGSLYAAGGGAPLAQATFASESASGWQTVTFANPVSITANTTYVAAYLAPQGGYSATGGAFSSGAIANPPLTAISNDDGLNGVYALQREPDVPDRQLERDELLGGRPVRPGSLIMRARILILLALAAAAAAFSRVRRRRRRQGRAGQRREPAQGRAAGRRPPSRARARTRARARARKAEQPGYQALVENQDKDPRSRFTPCNLVTKAQARAILGTPILEPSEGAQGPTCIYRSEDGKAFVTLAVQPVKVTPDPAQAAAGADRRRRRPHRLLRPVRPGDALRAARRGAAPWRSAHRATWPSDSPRRRCGSCSPPRALVRHVPGVGLRRARSRVQPRPAPEPAVRRTVILLGLTSLLTDISSEMVVTILPLYLVAVGGFSPLAFGVIDGIYNGATAIVRLASGYIGDRFKRHKEVAATGYGLSAICKLALVLVGTAVSSIAAVVLIDRFGKGIRTAPRDAMISLATPKEQLGTAFGVHRAMDTVGAMIGPLLAFVLLAIAPLAFDSVFLVSFCIAIVGFAVLVLFVNGRDRAPGAKAPGAPAVAARRRRAAQACRASARVLVAGDGPEPRHRQRRLHLPRAAGGARPRHVALPAAVRRQRRHVHGAGDPVRAARRPDRPRPACSSAATRCCSRPTSSSCCRSAAGSSSPATLGLLGAYYAATDGVLMALGSAVVPDEVRGSGLALLGSATSVARLFASVAFGGALDRVRARPTRSCGSASGSSSPARSPPSSCCGPRSRAGA